MPASNVSTFSLRVCKSAMDSLSPGDTVTLKKGEPLRILPNRREVHAGHWLENDEAIVSKRYLQHSKQERDSTREWQGLLKLQQLQVAAPKPLFIAEDPDDHSVCVVSRYLPGAEPLKALLPRLNRDGCAPIMQQLAERMIKMHDAGAYQSDQHIGNWAYSENQVYSLDAGTVHFSNTPLSETRRLHDLGALSATLPPTALHTFHQALKTLEHYSPQLDAATVNAQRKRLNRHYKKTRRSCTEYGRNDSSTHKGIYSKLADTKLVDAFFANPDSLMQTGTRLKSGNTCTVQAFEFGENAYVLKRYNLKPFATRLRRNFKESRALKSWSNAWCLLTAYIPTARPVAVYEERSGWLRGRCYLLMEQIDGQLLPDHLKASSDESTAAVVNSVANIWDSLRAIRAVHRDLKATNWMVDVNGEAVIFDLDALCFGLSDQAFLQGQTKDYARFIKNWSEQPKLAQRFSEKLLKGLINE